MQSHAPHSGEDAAANSNSGYVERKKKQNKKHLCVTGINPRPERLLTLVAHHNRVVTEGLRPSQGNYISHVLSEKKFISSCNELKDKLLSPLLNTQLVGTRNNLLYPTSWSLTSEH